MFKKVKLSDVEPVVLPYWHGIRPAYYILSLFFLFLLVVFFLLCLLPGIVGNTSYISVDSTLPVFALYEDGTYLSNGYGSVIETTSGVHKYEFYYEGIKIGEEEVNVPKHYFFTLFHHSVYSLKPEFTFTDETREKAEEVFLSDVVSYSSITDYSTNLRYPTPFKTYAVTATLMGVDDIRDAWLYAILHITSLTMYEDYTAAERILSSSAVKYTSEEEAVVKSYLDTLYTTGESEVKKDDETSGIKVSKDGNFYKYEGGKITIGSDTLTSYPSSNTLPVTLDYSTFYISGALVTENEYALFVEENKKWSKDNISALIEEGLVDSNYLSDINLSLRRSRPIRYISWYAAEAYCEWKSQKDGVEYSLPTIEEWTASAISAEDKAYVTSLSYTERDSSTPTGLMGQLWDMTSTVYIPLMRLIDEETYARLSLLYPYDDVIVMGGSYVNDNITVDTVGVVDKASSSPYNGFRLVKHE